MGSAARTVAPPPSHGARRAGREPTGGTVGGGTQEPRTSCTPSLDTQTFHSALVWVGPFGDPGRVRLVSVPGQLLACQARLP